MPSGCCGGTHCACQIVAEGGVTIEGSGQPGDPFILRAASDFTPWGNQTFLTDVVGAGSTADPWQVNVGYAPSAKLNDLPDVDTTAPTNGQVLTWNTAAGTWVASPPAVAPVGAVSHDSSLTGDGSAGTPLAVAPYGARYLGSFPQGIGLNDAGLVTVVHHYTNDAARTAALPTPTFNMLSMLDSGPGVIQWWNGVSWSVLPNQTEWSASESLLELSGPYNPTLRPVVMVIQLEVTTDANGVFDVLDPTVLTGRSGVLAVNLTETGEVAWKAMVFANTDRISATAYRLTDGSPMAGTPLTATVQAICY